MRVTWSVVWRAGWRRRCGADVRVGDSLFVVVAAVAAAAVAVVAAVAMMLPQAAGAGLPAVISLARRRTSYAFSQAFSLLVLERVASVVVGQVVVLVVQIALATRGAEKGGVQATVTVEAETAAGRSGSEVAVGGGASSVSIHAISYPSMGHTASAAGGQGRHSATAAAGNPFA